MATPTRRKPHPATGAMPPRPRQTPPRKGVTTTLPTNVKPMPMPTLKTNSLPRNAQPMPMPTFKGGSGPYQSGPYPAPKGVPSFKTGNSAVPNKTGSRGSTIMGRVAVGTSKAGASARVTPGLGKSAPKGSGKASATGKANASPKAKGVGLGRGEAPALASYQRRKVMQVAPKRQGPTKSKSKRKTKPALKRYKNVKGR